MTGEIKTFNKDKVVQRPHAGELFERVLGLVHEYDGEIGTAEAIGVLELAKLSIYTDAFGETED